MKGKVEEEIQRAIQQGKFKNLPGKGKPLKLDDNPYEDPSWRAAHRILRNGGYTLPWIESGREIQMELERCRADLTRIWLWSREAESEDRRRVWQQAERAFQEQVEAVNRKIRLHNLQAPLDRFQIRLVDIDRELAILQGAPIQAD